MLQRSDIRSVAEMASDVVEPWEVLAELDPTSSSAWANIVRTPTVRATKLSKVTGCELALKLENQQFTGSFKERGALTKLLSLTDTERQAGIVAASAGNHAQGLARHAALLGVSTTIFMPEHTPYVKIEQTRSYGAEVIATGADFQAAHVAADQFTRENGRTYVHPFDDPAICAGQGTIAEELLADFPEVDTIVIPIGGGGLAAGVASIVRHVRPDVQVIGVQAALFPGMLNRVKGLARSCGGVTLAEGIAVASPGMYTEKIISSAVDELITVEERDLERALSLLLNTQKVLAEGAGAAGLAALLAHPSMFAGRKVAIIISGGNIDMRLVSSILMRDLARQRRLGRLRIELVDVPGQLTLVSESIARAGGNVIDISYHRIFNDLPAKATYLDISVEASDGPQMDRIVDSVRAAGLSVQILTSDQASG
ncbi:MAG: threonine ammonia-lyase [Parvularcula sp.]